MIRSVAVAPLLVALLGPAAAAGDPHVDWMLQCQGCHLADGRGRPGEVPDLTTELDRLLRVPGGREYLASVPGAALSPLEDGRLAAVLNWMVQRFAGAGAAAACLPFTPEEVARLRRHVPPDALARRTELLAASLDSATVPKGSAR